MNINEIMALLPHRYPLLLVDRVLEIEPNESIVGYKNITVNEEVFNGHFPGAPIFPGVMTIEALAQISGILGFVSTGTTPDDGKLYLFAGVDKARFRSRVGPEDILHLHSEIVNEKKGIWKFETKAFVDDRLVCSATILCADRKA